MPPLLLATSMPYDPRLADRVRAALTGKGAVERKMFGGLAFLVRGKMLVGVLGDDLVVRVGPEGYERALRLPHARPMDFTGRPLRGLVYVGSAGVRTQAGLRAWLARAVPREGAASGKARRRGRREG
ncbi:MAG TPA: TfoX/Sxy family protein [Candidatus Thermoplasmatota archaeon]|nr:TfoX/Sxy family protein [Candidatus Thermoplasmatota archaeon]